MKAASACRHAIAFGRRIILLLLLLVLRAAACDAVGKCEDLLLQAWLLMRCMHWLLVIDPC
jgi:hypothetical protein